MKINKNCSLCGKKIVINVVDGKIKTKGIFHTRIPTRYFDGWAYQIEDIPTMKMKVRFKNTFWKIVAYTKVQRTIIYFFVKIFYETKKEEYWECKKCLKRPNDC